MEVGRYSFLALGLLAALVLVVWSRRRSAGGPGRKWQTDGWLYVGAFAFFILVDVATGQSLTGLPDPWSGVVAVLLFPAVIFSDAVIVVRRARSKS